MSHIKYQINNASLVYILKRKSSMISKKRVRIVKGLEHFKIMIWMSENTKNVKVKIHILLKCNFYGFYNKSQV